MTPRHFAWQAWHKETFTNIFAWQAWHSETFTFVLRGRRGTYGTGWHAWTAWQAWHSETFTFVLRGKRGTYGAGWRAWTGLVADDAAALCVAGVALGDIHLRFARQAWPLWHWVARLDRISRG